MYDTQEEIHQKLSGCILLYKGKHLYVLEAASPSRIRAYYPSDTNQTLFEVPLNDPELNYRNLGSYLGYINLNKYKGIVYNEATYMMRQPVRRSVQGLSRYNVYTFGLQGNPQTEAPKTSPLPFDNYLHSGENAAAFADMLNSQYKSIKDVNDTFNDMSVQSQAFHKKWALKRDETGPFQLMYKNTKVGYTEDLHRFVVADRYRFLKPDLKELNLLVA